MHVLPDLSNPPYAEGYIGIIPGSLVCALFKYDFYAIANIGIDPVFPYPIYRIYWPAQNGATGYLLSFAARAGTLLSAARQLPSHTHHARCDCVGSCSDQSIYRWSGFLNEPLFYVNQFFCSLQLNIARIAHMVGRTIANIGFAARIPGKSLCPKKFTRIRDAAIVFQ